MRYELGTFDTIQPTPDQLMSGMLLTPANLVNIQNLRAAAAQDIVNLEYDPEHAQHYALALVSKQAEVRILSYLIDCHHMQTAELEHTRKEQAEYNQNQ